MAFALRLMLLAAVLVQYTPMRSCALERVMTGSSCHDGTGVAVGHHEDEGSCGSTGSGPERCVCELPKSVGERQVTARLAFEFPAAAVIVNFVEESVVAKVVAAPDPDPQRDLLASVQLPLLI